MFIIAQVANYSDFVWKEQSKTRCLHLTESITNTFAEPGLGREAEGCMCSQTAAAAVFILAQVIGSGMNYLKHYHSTTNAFAEPGLSREAE